MSNPSACNDNYIKKSYYETLKYGQLIYKSIEKDGAGSANL